VWISREPAPALEDPHQGTDQHKQPQGEHDQGAELPDDRDIGHDRRDGPGLLGEGDRDAGAVGRIGEFDVSQPVRRDGDRPDRRVELTTLDSADEVPHLRDRDKAIAQMEVVGDAPPKVDAGT